jgi:hypothetical protein
VGCKRTIQFIYNPVPVLLKFATDAISPAPLKEHWPVLFGGKNIKKREEKKATM